MSEYNFFFLLNVVVKQEEIVGNRKKVISKTQILKTDNTESENLVWLLGYINVKVWVSYFKKQACVEGFKLRIVDADVKWESKHLL